jgi:branched-chain amino acid transport system substrate-binding protein
MNSAKNSSHRRWASIGGLGVIAALALAACAPPGASSEPSSAPTGEESATGTLKVGYISPITGNFAIAGQEMVDGWNLYWELNGT